MVTGERLYWILSIVGIILILLILWIVSVQRRLTVMNENVDDALNQLGVQLSARLDALLKLAERYAEGESRFLLEKLRLRRSAADGYTPEDIRKQENMISDVLRMISELVQHHPERKASEDYIKCMDAAENCENMLRTSRLIYNDRVARLNHELRRFPTAIIARVCGFRPREYVEALKAVE